MLGLPGLAFAEWLIRHGPILHPETTLKTECVRPNGKESQEYIHTITSKWLVSSQGSLV